MFLYIYKSPQLETLPTLLTVNYNCGRLDRKEKQCHLIKRRRGERKQSGPNSLKEILVHVAGVAYSFGQQKACTLH